MSTRTFRLRLRFWLVLVVALLLPLRGAVAAAMPCEMGGAAHGATAAMEHTAMDHAAMGHANHAACPHADHHAPSADDATPKCPMCAAFCCAAPLVGPVASVFEPLETRAVAYPDVIAAAPSFVAGRQERPPRSA